MPLYVKDNLRTFLYMKKSLYILNLPKAYSLMFKHI